MDFELTAAVKPIELVSLADDLAEAMDKGRQMDMTIPDFSKAFDRVTVPHL